MALQQPAFRAQESVTFNALLETAWSGSHQVISQALGLLKTSLAVRLSKRYVDIFFEAENEHIRQQDGSMRACGNELLAGIPAFRSRSKCGFV